MLFNAPRPWGKVGRCSSMTSMGVSQDIGGAIKGAHVDWYLGEGADAAKVGDVMNAKGSVFLAIIPGAGKPIARCGN